MAETAPSPSADDATDGDPLPGRPQAANAETAQAFLRFEACIGFSVLADGSRFRLQLADGAASERLAEFPLSGLPSLLKTLVEIQQAALPRTQGNPSLRVIRQPINWSLERDLSDDTLLMVLSTPDGYEWCFALADREIFRMADCLREERAVTLPAPESRQ